MASAEFLYLSTAAALITTAIQAFDKLVVADYVAAFPDVGDQAAVSGAWTRVFNAMAADAQTAFTTEASAYQVYLNGMAADIRTTMNNMAGDASVQRKLAVPQTGFPTLWGRSSASALI